MPPGRQKRRVIALGTLSIAWRTMPFTAKLGVSFWGAAWIYFLLHIFRLSLTQGGDWALEGKLAIAVCLLLFFLLRGQNWARMIALMSSALSVLFLSFLTYIHLAQANRVETALAFLGIVIFGFAVYYLTLHETADYFKTTSKTDHPS
jgi:hypothetical protein